MPFDRAVVTGPGEFMASTGRGVLAALRRNRGNLDVLRPVANEDSPYYSDNAILFEEEWEQIDEAVVEAAEERLVGVADFLSTSSLIHPLRNIGVMLSTYRRESDATPASQSMSGVAQGEQFHAEYDEGAVPVPITHKDFEIEGRRLIASDEVGEGLDVSQARLAGRQVSEKLEEMLFLGGDLTIGGNPIYGLTTEPQRNTGSVAAAWTTATTAQGFGDVLAMRAALMADNYFGPYWLYVAGNWAQLLDEDYQVGTDVTDRTLRERIMAVGADETQANNQGRIERIRVADKLTSALVMLQRTPDVCDMAVAERLNTLQWETHGGMLQHFKTMAVLVPRPKHDKNLNSGIAHYT